MGDGRVHLRWDWIDGAVSFKVYRDTSADPTTLVASPTTDELYDVITPGDTYYYRVKAHNASGDSASYSDNLSIDIGDGLPNISVAILPPGGTSGQVLTKLSDADYDVAWADLP